jgi:hypothetical protein
MYGFFKKNQVIRIIFVFIDGGLCSHTPSKEVPPPPKGRPRGGQIGAMMKRIFYHLLAYSSHKKIADELVNQIYV